MTYRNLHLKNGLTVYVVPMPGTATATVLVLVRAGSKYETKHTNGLSHFLEHMFFKGTKKRPTAKDVSEVLDGVGGEYNAFTDKERTGYYAKVDVTHLELAIDWVSDMLLNSLMDKDEMEREKGVIQQELSMYYDTPTSHIDDVFESLLYGDQPAGWDIGGTKQTVANVKRADLISYFSKRYLANETTIVVAGNIQVKQTEKLIEKYFKGLRHGKAPNKKPVHESQKQPALKIEDKKTDQTHLMLGVRAFDVYDKRRHALGLLSVILGGNMSSRLFSSLREKYGLAYYVSTRSQLYSDTGYLVTSAGVPNDKIVESVSVIMAEYESILKNGIDENELKKAKDFIKGKTLIGLESSNSMAGFVGEQAMTFKKAVDAKELLKKVNAVTVRDINKIAETIFKNNRLNLALIGPKGKEKELKSVLKFK